MKRSFSGVHVLELAFEHGGHSVPIVDTFVLGGDFTKPSITIARVDRFYSNLVLCLQLDIALLFQNSVKI